MLISLARLIARLPLAWLHGVGALLGLMVLRVSAGFRRKTHDNLAQAGLDVDGVGRRSAQQAGRAVTETALVWFGDPQRIDHLIRFEDLPVLETARAAGRGVIILTPHLGGFEAGARAIARVTPVTALYKPARIAALRRLVEAGRAMPGLHPAPATPAGVRSLLRALRRGECIGILPDQVPSDGDGQWAPFFGRPAYTMTLPSRLAEMTGAPVIIAYALRLDDAQGWRVYFEPLEAAPSPDAINHAMEAVIRRIPDQYFWGYNRYKVPARAQASKPDSQAGATS